MAASPDDRPADPAQDGVAQPAARHHRPWGWITASVVLLLVAVGLGIWALSLHSELGDQRDETAQAQQQAEQANQEVEALSTEVDQISQTVSNAGEQLSQAGADAQQKAQQSIAGLETKLQSLKGEIQNAIDKQGASSSASTP